MTNSKRIEEYWAKGVIFVLWILFLVYLYWWTQTDWWYDYMQPLLSGELFPEEAIGVLIASLFIFVIPLSLLSLFSIYLYRGEPTSKFPCCIIATCALPSQHPDLQYLRHFRDEMLKPTKLGRLIVWLYYALSPPIALMVLASKQIKRLVRKRFIPLWIKICKEWEEKRKKT